MNELKYILTIYEKQGKSALVQDNNQVIRSFLLNANHTDIQYPLSRDCIRGD